MFSEARLMNQVKKLKDHIIICGGGRVGVHVADVLARYGKAFIILDENAEAVEKLKREGHMAINADALDEKDLLKAGINNASHLLACLGEDGDNILLVLTAKELNPSITIAVRATTESTITKLKHAGAKHIVLPEALGGLHLAHAVLKDDKNN